VTSSNCCLTIVACDKLSNGSTSTPDSDPDK
jgi:hypothetical protein